MSVELKVTGMTCAHCEKAVLDVLAAVPDDTAVRVDRASGLASVDGHAEQQALMAAVAEEGYQAEPAAGAA